MDARRAGETIRDDGRGRRDAGEQWRDAPARLAAASRPMARDRRRATVAAWSRPAAAGAAARGTAAAGPVCDTRVRRAHSRSHARPRGAPDAHARENRSQQIAPATTCQAGGGQGDASRKRLGQCGSARTLRAQTSSAASHSHAAQYGGGKTKSRQAGHDSAASYAASAQASATSNTSSTQSEPARRSFIVRPRVRAGIAVADVQHSTGAGGARIDPRRRFPRAAPPMPTAHTAPRPRVSRIQPSRYLRLVVQALGRGTPHWKQRPSHRAARRVRQGGIACRPRPGLRGDGFFDSSAYQPPAWPEERPSRKPLPASRLPRALCAVPQRFGARLHVAHRLRSRDGRGNGAGCRFTDATFRSGRTPPVPAWGKSPCARNGRRCLRCRVSRTAEAAVVPTLDHPAFVSGHAPIAA